jgi:hypothetical protein
MKAVPHRGMRDVATMQGLIHQSAQTTRSQAVSRFAHLESERARLMREIATWAARQNGTMRALAAVDEELLSLRHVLLAPPSADEGAAVRPQRRNPPTARAASGPGTQRGNSAESGAETSREEAAALLRGGMPIEY